MCFRYRKSRLPQKKEEEASALDNIVQTIKTINLTKEDYNETVASESEIENNAASAAAAAAETVGGEDGVELQYGAV